jgi:ubiquinone/menaquinone biosynthesis C-methylase UbiE
VTLRTDEVGRKVAPFLEPEMQVLDLGAGTGLVSQWLSDRRGIRPTLVDVVEYSNRVSTFPFLRQSHPLRIPAPDASFDAVMALFVLHHIEEWLDQEVLLKEAARVSRRRLILIEDTPRSRLDRVFNVGWDFVLNLRHGVPKPFTFRTVEGWLQAFGRLGLTVVHVETYRPKWPTLMTYHHTLFVLER